jgi:hypothetical protein
MIGSSWSRPRQLPSGSRAAARVPYELVVALLLVVVPVATGIALEGLVPHPGDGSHSLVRSVRGEIRNDLVRYLALAPTLVGCLWCLRSAVANRMRSAAVFLVVISLLAMVQVVEALLILSFVPGALTSSSWTSCWRSEDAYAAARLSNWAAVITMLIAFVAWHAWKTRRVGAAA